MPYRDSAATRKNMKTVHHLDKKEMRQALLDFLYEREVIPSNISPTQVFIKVSSWDADSDFSCTVTFNKEVLVMSSS